MEVFDSVDTKKRRKKREPFHNKMVARKSRRKRGERKEKKRKKEKRENNGKLLYGQVARETRELTQTGKMAS